MDVARWYSVEFHAVTVTAQQDLFFLKPAADKPIVIAWAKVRNVGGTADAGDAKEDLWRIELVYLPATVTAGTGGTTPTPRPLRHNDAAASFTARANDATTLSSSSGTAYNLDSDGMNNRIGYDFLPIPELMPVVANADAVALKLLTTPANSETLNGTIYVGELV